VNRATVLIRSLHSVRVRDLHHMQGQERTDRLGRALFIGTPKGLNHFYDLFQNAQGQAHWAAFRFTTEEGGNVPSAELEQAAHDLDQRTYQQAEVSMAMVRWCAIRIRENIAAPGCSFSRSEQP
jgi:hypothetical protein